MNDEFYIGWERKAPAGLAARVRLAIIGLLILGPALAVGLAVAQRTIGVSVYEWGHVKEFSGILRAHPYPHLLVARPGITAGQSAFSSYYLVKTFKFGLEPEIVARFDGQAVTMRGTLIYRDNQTMIEAISDSIKAVEHPDSDLGAAKPVEPVSLGHQTLVGEIVDSKCYFGVMNPGRFAPHRACAIRCISGGAPPVLLVEQTKGPPLCFMLVSSAGRSVNHEVLDFVAEPLRITGEVIRQGDLLTLRAEPSTYRRVLR